MADVHVNIANGLKIGLKTKLILRPQSGRIDLENPTFAKGNKGNGVAPPSSTRCGKWKKSHKYWLDESNIGKLGVVPQSGQR